MFLSPLGERLGEGGVMKAVSRIPLTQPLPKGERSLRRVASLRGWL
jgi:hypothetical protein